MRHHAFVIEAEAEEGIDAARSWAETELGMAGEENPDIVVLRYGLLSVEDARYISTVSASAPVAGERKAIIIAASRAYREAQNALLKLFEEPPRGTYLFLVLPAADQLLPTLRSRVHILKYGYRKSITIPEAAREFIKASRERRSAMIKKLVSGKDEEERRALRDEAVALINGVEAAAYERFSRGGRPRAAAELLSDIAVLRGYLHDRSAPTRMILEHVSLVIPDDVL